MYDTVIDIDTIEGHYFKIVMVSSIQFKYFWDSAKLTP